jgi:long-chain acyl-CoA synthetase
LARWAKSKNLSVTEETGIVQILNEIKSVFNQYMPGGVYSELFPSRWLPSAIAILDEPFTSDNKQLNSLGKMVRAKIVEKHKDTIEFLYSPEARSIVNKRNLESVRKLLNPKSN